jgi:hypothetical protein
MVTTPWSCLSRDWISHCNILCYFLCDVTMIIIVLKGQLKTILVDKIAILLYQPENRRNLPSQLGSSGGDLSSIGIEFPTVVYDGGGIKEKI